MRPPAPVSPLERTLNAGPRPVGRPLSALAAAVTGLVSTGVAGFLACLALLASGCTVSEWPDRDPIEVRGAPIDTLEFLPIGSRFVLVDSLTKVRVGGFRLGFSLVDGCTQILAFGLEKESSPTVGYAARLDYRLPAVPDCPLDSGTRDSVLSVRFTAADAPIVRLVDSLGTVFDTALAVRGKLFHDSLELKGTATSAFNSRFFFQDTSSLGGRRLSGDSLTACERLNHAEYVRKSDSLKVVRYSWVTLDAPVPPDTCAGSPTDKVIVPISR